MRTFSGKVEEEGTPGDIERVSQDKKGTWVRNCTERSKRETEVFVLVEEMAATGKSDEHTHQGHNIAKCKTTPQSP